MMFSVVIPLYNKAAYIALTLHSVAVQTVADYEVIVVDDGSTDDGPQIVQSLSQADPRIRLVRQANAGVSAARNAGIAAAVGEWIAFLDADDWWHPSYLAQQARAIHNYPEVDMVATQLRIIPDVPGWTPLPWPVIPLEPAIDLIHDLPSRWMQGIPFCTDSVVLRRSRLMVMQPCFAVDESMGEDLELWFRIAEISSIAHTRTPLIAYRSAGATSLTSQHKQLVMPPFLFRMRRRVESGAMPEYKRKSSLKLIANYQITLARQALIQGQRLSSLKWLFQCKESVLTKRWLVTLMMLLVFPGSLVQRWMRWRYQRVAA